jgi:hypothetical protein
MSDETIETLRSNLDKNIENFIKYYDDPSWIERITDERTFITKKYTIEHFQLTIPKDNKDKETEIENSIVLYEHLKDLPMYVLTDERFWNWINFDIGYEVALKMMPVQEGSSVIKDHWLFSQGNRRGLFFGVLSRAFLRVMLTVDKTTEDPYELTRFIIEKPERFRNLSWRTFSSQKHIVMGALKAEKKIYDEYGEIEKSKYFTEIAKYVSKLGSVRLLDVMTEKDIYDYVYEKYKELIKIDLEKNEEVSFTSSIFRKLRKSVKKMV